MKIQELPADDDFSDGHLRCSQFNGAAYIGRTDELTFVFQSTAGQFWQGFTHLMYLLSGIRSSAIVNSLLPIRSDLSVCFLSPAVNSILWMR